ncbi:MAG: SDR family NAD(P)-dependent oxidoreductase [Candidatus Baltobacteraceae bacterium]
MRRINGRSVFVTGAASGLAAGIAAGLARDGFARVAITWRESSPEDTLARIRAAGATASATQIDFLADQHEIERALEDCVREHGPFDTLVHAVGPLQFATLERADGAAFRAMFDGNVRGMWLAARAVLPTMREAGFGRIVAFGMNGSSQAAPAPGLGLHAAAKSALVSLLRTLAAEVAESGITVNVIEPGDIREKSLDRSEARKRPAANPVGRAGSYEDVLDAVRFLIAPERDFITGAVLPVTGGLQGPHERNMQR